MKQFSSTIRYLRGIAMKFKFGTTLDDQLAVAISNGVRDVKLQEKPWSHDLALGGIMKTCQQWEQRESMKHLYSKVESEVHVTNKYKLASGVRGTDRRYQYQNYAPKQASPGRGRSHTSQSSSCFYKQDSDSRNPQVGHSRKFINECSKCVSSHAVNRCHAHGKRCNDCGKLIHFAKRCRNRRVHYTDCTDAGGAVYNCEGSADHFNVDRTQLLIQSCVTREVITSQVQKKIGLFNLIYRIMNRLFSK